MSLKLDVLSTLALESAGASRTTARKKKVAVARKPKRKEAVKPRKTRRKAARKAGPVRRARAVRANAPAALWALCSDGSFRLMGTSVEIPRAAARGLVDFVRTLDAGGGVIGPTAHQPLVLGALYTRRDTWLSSRQIAVAIGSYDQRVNYTLKVLLALGAVRRRVRAKDYRSGAPSWDWQITDEGCRLRRTVPPREPEPRASRVRKSRARTAQRPPRGASALIEAMRALPATPRTIE